MSRRRPAFPHRDLMNMFKAKIAAVAASLLLTVGVMSASSMVSADASGTDEGPCITAVHVSDPSITAQRGNCTEAPVEQSATYSTNLQILINSDDMSDARRAGKNPKFNAKIVAHDPYRIVTERSGVSDADGTAVLMQFTDSKTITAGEEPPKYELIFTWADQTTTYDLTSSGFMADWSAYEEIPDGDPTAYVLQGDVICGHSIACWANLR